MDVLEALHSRRSIRQYLPDAVDRSALEAIVDAARMAATARNDQPWEFVVVTERARLDKLAELAIHGKFLAQTPAAILVFCKRDAKYCVEDGSAATQNILLAAHALGLGSCWINGSQAVYAREVEEYLGVGEEMRLISINAIGKVKATPAPIKRSLAEVIHWEKF